jgi:hypothetical protein
MVYTPPEKARLSPGGINKMLDNMGQSWLNNNF